MQSRILQVTHLGNFQPWLPRHIVDGRPQGRSKTRVVGVVAVNCTIARLRGSSRRMTMMALWLPINWGIHDPISLQRPCRQPPNVGK
jgi:hypothetical protein